MSVYAHARLRVRMAPFPVRWEKTRHLSQSHGDECLQRHNQNSKSSAFSLKIALPETDNFFIVGVNHDLLKNPIYISLDMPGICRPTMVPAKRLRNGSARTLDF